MLVDLPLRALAHTSGKSWFQLWSRSRWSWRRATDLSTSRHNRIPMLWHLCHHRWHFPKGFASWAKLLGMVKFPPYDGSPHTQKHTPTRTRNNTPQDKTRQYDIRPSLKAAKTREPPFIYREPPLYTRAPFIYREPPLYIREPPVYTESPPLYKRAPCIYREPPFIYREPPLYAKGAPCISGRPMYIQRAPLPRSA